MKKKEPLTKENSDLIIRIGRLAREYRLNTGYTQKEFADKAELSRSSIQALERGGNPTLATLLKYIETADGYIQDLLWQEK